MAEPMKISYTRVGDYELPDLMMPEQPEVTLGKWAFMRQSYLEEHRRIMYLNLLTSGKLTAHLAEVQERARKLEEELMNRMAEKQGVTEKLKAEDMMKWVQMMNNIRDSAEEIVKAQVIFV